MDRLEQDLRRVLTDPRHALPADRVSVEHVHAGAARRRRRRDGALALGVAAVVASGVVLFFQPWDSGGAVGPAEVSTTPSSTPTDAPPSPTPSQTPSASQSADPTTPAAAPSGRIESDFSPFSFTAVSPRAYWVLGSQSCAPDSGNSRRSLLCQVLAVTTDGGASFTRLTAPAGRDTDGIRFATASDGWLYGRATHSTHDGGRTWIRVPLNGDVVHLEAGAGTVWAVVQSGSSYELFASPTDHDAWHQVALPRRITAPEPDLAVQGARMLLLANGSSADLYVSDDGGATIQRFPSPCTPDLGGSLSAVADGVWAKCATGTMARLAHSTDGTAPFEDVSGPSLPNSAVIGARTATEVVVGDAVRTLTLVTATGTQTATRTPHKPVVSYIGFTTPTVGVALVDNAAIGGALPGRQLWRTTDRGRTWTTVRFAQ